MSSISDFLIGMGIPDSIAGIIVQIGLFLLTIIAAFLADLIARKFIGGLVQTFAKRTATVWDDIIVEKGVFKRLAHYAPALIIYHLTPLILQGSDGITAFVQRLVLVYMIAVTILFLSNLLEAVIAIYQTYEISRSRPIKGYVQVVSIFVYIVGFVLMVTTLLNVSPAGILSGIGALSAVILLVFKDSILGLVSSVQLSANNLIRIGDWIEVPQFGADGDVIDITLQSVKVQNFDKTIVTFPIYALTSSSFRNWRGMAESGGRRIKRSLSIDTSSIAFLTREELQRLSQVDIIRDYIKDKLNEIGDFSEHPLNGRRLTNVGCFRAYIASYLTQHPQISDSMTFLVRQLAPTTEGLPLEIYVFSKQQNWAIYEGIQSDIFDHLLAAAPEFGLRLFQKPAGSDLKRLSDIGK